METESSLNKRRTFQHLAELFNRIFLIIPTDSRESLYKQYIEINKFWRILYDFEKRADGALNSYQKSFSDLTKFKLYIDNQTTKVPDDIMFVYNNVLYLHSKNKRGGEYNVLCGIQILPGMNKIFPVNMSGYFMRNFTLPLVLGDLVIKPYLGYEGIDKYVESCINYMYKLSQFEDHPDGFVEFLLPLYREEVNRFLNMLQERGEIDNRIREAIEREFLQTNVNLEDLIQVVDMNNHSWFYKMAIIYPIKYIEEVFGFHYVNRRYIAAEYFNEIQRNRFQYFEERFYTDMKIGRVVLNMLFQVTFTLYGIPYRDVEGSFLLISPLISRAYFTNDWGEFYKQLNIDASNLVFDNRSESFRSLNVPFYFNETDGEQYDQQRVDQLNIIENLNREQYSREYQKLMRIMIVNFYFMCTLLDEDNREKKLNFRESLSYAT